MAELKQILRNVAVVSITGEANEVMDLQLDSRKVTLGSCFIAVKGTINDGHLHIDKAIENGATTVVCEYSPTQVMEGVCYVIVENGPEAAGIIAHNFYGRSSELLILVGVTGTNGKTTIATLLFKLFSALGYQCGDRKSVV